MSSQACVVQLLLPQDEYSKGPQPLFVVRNTVQGEEGMTDQDLKNKINEKLHNSHEEAGFQSHTAAKLAEALGRPGGLHS